MTPARRMLLSATAAIAPGVLVFVGDSITLGGQVGLDAGEEFRTLCQASLLGSFSATNLAVGGRYIDNPVSGTDMRGDLTAAAALLNASARWGYGSAVRGVLVVLGGANDWTSGGADGAELIARMTDLLTDARADGWDGTYNKIVVGTVFGIDDPDKSTYNAWLAGEVGGLFDVLVTHPTELDDRDDASMYLENPNGLHPGPAGHALLSVVFAAGINTAVALPA